ncbi:MAG: Na/Pi cotransporter family protein [Planctomycetota bacterium]|nr:MAG: Na/Pi cotransporter family protein [Planctomycetota bacterium]
MGPLLLSRASDLWHRAVERPLPEISGDWTVAQDFETFPLIMELIGGLAVFLLGMDMMAFALKSVAGDRMRGILAKLTGNRFAGVVTGALVTAVIQSSSVTTVLVVGFITAGLMSLVQSVGVIMGANIGTTITAQIVAFKVTKYALLMVAMGFLVMSMAKRQNTKNKGKGILGLGLVFFGMSIMGDAMYPLRSYQPFLDWMAEMEKPWLGILAAAAFTSLVQSSSATTGVVIVMATQGFISLPAGIAMSFGANIGTCITALLAAIGKPREALRAALVHVMFNVAGVALWFAFIHQLADVVQWISPGHSELTGVDKLAAETPRQIANAHTIFNIANTLIFIGFATQFARLVEWLVPDRPTPEEKQIRARYLNEELLDTPALALDRARMELIHLGDLVKEMLEAILPAALSGEEEDLQEVEKMDDGVDTLHGQIVTYLGKVSQRQLIGDHTDELLKLMESTNDLENIGDIIETNLVSLGRSRLQRRFRVSAETTEVIQAFQQAVNRALEDALIAVTQRNREAALRVIGMKKEINRLAGEAAVHQAQRLVAEEPNRLSAYSMEMDFFENLKRIYYFCKRMARLLSPSEKLN